MSSNTPVAPSGDPGEAVRSLPAKPSLEFERKRAKALLRQLRRDDPEVKLAAAQLITARELGFATWPRLVQYFRTLERDALTPRSLEGYTSELYDGQARSLLTEHRLKREWAGRTLAAFVPRFYGRSIADVLALPVTTDDARLAIARQNRCSSWDHLLQESAVARAQQSDPWTRQKSPFARAAQAIKACDVSALERIIDEHPELLYPPEDDERRWRSILFSAVIIERRERTPESRRVTDWLASRAMNLSRTLNFLLLRWFLITVAEVQYLLDRGADPNWMPPNGVSVLEHALLRYSNSEAVDLLARHTVPRRAFWIAAGLGDVGGVARYFGRDGKLIAAAYRDRPPFDLMPSSAAPSLPDPDELEILAEAALVAAMNGRTAVIELLVDRGFPIDYAGWGGTSLLRYAISQRNVAMVETLLRLGADLDKKGEWPHASAREFARLIVRHYPDSAELRTILELCGAGTLEDALAEFDQERPSPPPLAKNFPEVFDLAGDDAARRGQTEIRGENLFVALLRLPYFPLGLLGNSGVDVERLRGMLADRRHPAADRVARSELPFAAEANAIIERAVAIADERRRELVTVLPLLAALVEHDSSFAADVVVASGGNLSQLREKLTRA